MSLQVNGATVYAKLGDIANPEATDMRVYKGGVTFAVLANAVNLFTTSLGETLRDVAMSNNGDLIIIGGMSGSQQLWRSTDNGKTWLPITTGAWHGSPGYSAGKAVCTDLSTGHMYSVFETSSSTTQVFSQYR